MSLNAWEQQALDSIRDRLASSDPSLVARLSMFTRLASGEEMPAREKIHPVPRQAPVGSDQARGLIRRFGRTSRAGIEARLGLA